MLNKPQAPDTTGGVDAVERALRVLDSFEPGDAGLSLKEVAERSGVNKATILRLSVSLEKFGHITRDAEGLFHLGPSLWRLGSVFRQNLRMGPIVRPVLSNLVNATGKARRFMCNAATAAFASTVSIRLGLRGIISKRARSFR